MPELPEVETIRRQLAPVVEGRTIEDVEILDPRWTRPLAPAEVEAALRGRRVVSLRRRGKYLLWELDGDVHLAQHLRMTGAVLADPDPDPTHARVAIELGPRAAGRGRRGGAKDAQHVRLVIDDPRRFGTGELLLGTDQLTRFLDARLGLEPFDEGFTGDYLRTVMRGRRAPIKTMLLDQRRLAGVGNIYADEALFRAGIHPLRAAGSLTREEAERLRDGIREALQAGIEARGASIDDFRDIEGVQGSFQNRFLVHRREGEPCPRCGGEVVKIVVGGRGTYVCERCQPRPRGRKAAVTPRVRKAAGPRPSGTGAARGGRPPRRRAAR
ncbi:MAG TPA: bifunctional DNA-formamidopyrimidine glycosylase/DNA-(apurinic or apyrimidinic site) lyase [Solirubrobacteraceae bacterium]|jgi:formamidopyrimidine-DNA glycosylase|nr:bifunctional DNA-formamidopyrimidine glycosylase/DNA-(apurinic or apyrimidinic site) lyase [Solirubrobacteraceae bacterium]